MLAALVTVVLTFTVPAPTHAHGAHGGPGRFAPLCTRTRHSSMENWHEQRDGDVVRWRAHWSGDDCTIDLRATGEVKFNSDFTDVVAITDNGSLDVTAIDGTQIRKLSIRSSGGRLTRTWSLNGREQPWDDTARRWLADFLVELDRTSAFAVDYRYPALYAQGGARAVLDESEKMTNDYARSVYLRRLVDSAKLNEGEYQRVVAIAARDMTSDYEMSRILRAVAERAPLDNDAMRKPYLDAVAKMSSDYERSRVLQTIFAKTTMSHELAHAAVRAAGTFSSDYERSRVLLAAIESKALDRTDVIPILEIAAKSHSDYEKSRVLISVVSHWTLDADSRKAYLRAADTIHSDYENRRVLSALVKQEARQ